MVGDELLSQINKPQDLTKVHNEMIAIWMGVKNVWVHPMLGVYEAEDETGYIDWVDNGFRSLDYHRNWNLLMPVVEKIADLYEESDHDRHWNKSVDKLRSSILFADIVVVHQAVVYFIRWHNTQNQTN